MFVKISVLCSAFLVVIISVDAFNVTELNKSVEECGKLTNTDESEYASPTILLSTPSENLLCMAKCILEKLEIVDSDGTIAKEKLSEYIDIWPQKLQTAELECEDKIKRVSSCDDVEEYRKCLQPALEQVFKLN